MKVLVVEDDQKLARFLQLELEHENYEVSIAGDGRLGLEMAQGDIDIVLLDIMLPKLSGIEVIRRLRQVSNVPVIMLTAKGDVSDKVVGLDSGADDYITKPFAIEELLARIRAATSRKGIVNHNIINCGKLYINADNFMVKYDDIDIELTKKEFELLHYLAINKDKVLSRKEIISSVWGYNYVGETNVVDVYILYLRNKINKPFSVNLIQTVRGFGYTLKT